MLFDLAAVTPKDAYKLLVATVVPRPIAWIVSRSAQGALNCAPFSFFNAFSGDPPLLCIGVGLRKPGVAKDTGLNIDETGEFVINLVPEELAEAMNITAIDFDYGVDELQKAGLTPVPSTKIATPRIGESPVSIECVKHEILHVGPGHRIVVGRAVAIHVRDDAVLDAAKCYIDTPKLKLIGRMHGSGWYVRTSDRFEMPRKSLDDGGLG